VAGMQIGSVHAASHRNGRGEFSNTQPYSDTAIKRPIGGGGVRYSQTLNDARLSCREVNRFFGIELYWAIAGQMA